MSRTNRKYGDLDWKSPKYRRAAYICTKYKITYNQYIEDYHLYNNSWKSTQVCKTCEVEMSVDNFYRQSNGRPLKSCKVCHSRKTRRFRSEMKTKYGITESEYNELINKSNNSCMICGVDLIQKGCIDHCHKTGKIRGLLCNSCNLILGHAKDNIDILTKAIDYLKLNN